MTRYFLDCETTGLLARHADPYTLDAEPRIVSIAVVTSAGEVVGSQRVNPGCAIPPASTEKHRITDAMVADAPAFARLAVLGARDGQRHAGQRRALAARGEQ